MTLQLSRKQTKSKTLCLQASQEIINAIDEVMNTLGFSNRSEAIRFAIWYTNLQLKEIETLTSAESLNTKQRLIDLVVRAVRVVR